MIVRTVSAAAFAPELSGCSASLTVCCRSGSRTPAGQSPRWGVIVCPGGGYELIAETEAEPPALGFLAAGVQAFILRYSLLPAAYPAQLRELGCAVRWVRAHAAEFGIGPVAVCGFSAGGHLAGCLANRWNAPELRDLVEDPALLRPDAAILCYPVISSRLFPSRRSLAGVDPSLPEFSQVDLDTGVTSENPPAFLWCTGSDPMVPMENTMAYALALRRAGVPFELHVFPDGPHAMSTADEEGAPGRSYADPHVARWLPLCLEWLKSDPDRPRKRDGAAT